MTDTNIRAACNCRNYLMFYCVSRLTMFHRFVHTMLSIFKPILYVRKHKYEPQIDQPFTIKSATQIKMVK